MFLGCQDFWINQWLQIPVNMNLSAYNKGKKGNVFRILHIIYIFAAKCRFCPKNWLLPVGVDRPQKCMSERRPEGGMFFTLDMRTFLQDGALGCIYCSCWSPGPQEFSNLCFQTCTKLGDFCHIYLSLFVLFFSFFEAGILVLRVLVLIPINEPLGKTELEIIHVFLMRKAG